MNSEYHNEQIEVDIVDVIWVLLKKIWLIIAIGLLCAIGMFGILKLNGTPNYQSVCQILILKQETDTRLAFDEKVLKDSLEMITSRTVIEKWIEVTGMQAEYGQVVGKVSAQIVDGTRIIEIAVNDTEPERAKELADALQEVVAGHLQDAFEIYSVKGIEKGNLPMVPVGRKNSIYIAAAFCIGVFLAAAGVFVWFLLEGTIKTPENISRYLKCVTLGSISEKNISTEAFRFLRTNIEASKKETKTILFTNCEEKQDLQKVSRELASSYTECGYKVIHISVDVLGKGNVETKEVKGVTDYVMTDGERKLFPCNMEWLDKLKEEYDKVIFCVPALHKYADAAIVAEQCDGTVVVVSKGKVHYRKLRETISQLKYVRADVLGCVLDNV